MKIQRTHDRLYLHEDRKNNPKEYFKFIERRTRDYLSVLDNGSVIDVGCATGDFLWFLLNTYPNLAYSGVDVMPELVERSREILPKIAIYEGNIYTGEGLPKEKFDAVFMLSVHMIFDDFKPWLENLLRLCKKSGRIYVFGMFNPEPVDVLVKAKLPDSADVWEAGWNVFSCESVLKYLTNNNIPAMFTPWQIPIDIAPHEGDPFRSWTILQGDGKRLIVNGTCVVQYTYLLEIINK